jgi:hypothetical protein
MNEVAQDLAHEHPLTIAQDFSARAEQVADGRDQNAPPCDRLVAGEPGHKFQIIRFRRHDDNLHPIALAVIVSAESPLSAETFSPLGRRIRIPINQAGYPTPIREMKPTVSKWHFETVKATSR